MTGPWAPLAASNLGWRPGVVVAAACLWAGLFLLFIDVADQRALLVLAAGILLANVLAIVGWWGRLMRFARFGTVAVLGGVCLWYAVPAVAFHCCAAAARVPAIGLAGRNPAFVALLLLALFMSGLQAGLLILPRREGVRMARKRPPADPARVLAWCVLLAGVGLLPYLILGEGMLGTLSQVLESRALEKPWAHTGNLGTATSPLLVIAQSALVAACSLSWVLLGDRGLRPGSRLSALVVALLGSVIVFFDTGTRTLSALILGPALVLFLLRAAHLPAGRRALTLSALALCIASILQFQMLYRSVHTRSEIAVDLLWGWSNLSNTIDFHRETVFAAGLVPDQHDYFREPILLDFVVAPIPRGVWPSKPRPQMIQYYGQQRWNVNIYESSGNVLPGIIGQFYMNWGWAGVLLAGLGIGLLAAGVDKLATAYVATGSRYGIAVAAMGAVWLFLSFRHLSPGFLYPLTLAALVVHFSVRRTSFGRVSVMRRA